MTVSRAIAAVTLAGLYAIEWTRPGVRVDDLRREKNGRAFRTASGDDGCAMSGTHCPRSEYVGEHE